MLASELPKPQIIKRPRQAKRFVHLPKRWIVERAIAWLNCRRRLAKDSENLNRKSDVSGQTLSEVGPGQSPYDSVGGVSM
jgi:transposase